MQVERDRCKRPKPQIAEQAPPAPITYPYVWYPPEPIAPRQARPTMSDAQRAKVRAKVQQEREEARFKRLMQKVEQSKQRKTAKAKKLAKAAREHEQRQAEKAERKAKAALERQQHRVQLLEEQRLRDVEKHPRPAIVLPYEGPPVTLDDLDELDISGPTSVHVDPELLHTLSEQDDGFVHEDDEEISAMLMEELNAPPAALTPPLNHDYRQTLQFRKARRRYLLRRWRNWNRS